MAKFTLIDGTQVEHELPCYQLAVWNAGKWNTVALFDLTVNGYAMAENTCNWINAEHGCKRINVIR